jgi:hypothetical protein
MNTDKHHPSCRPSDSHLVWLCAQCGAVESAQSLVEALEHCVASFKEIRRVKKDESPYLAEALAGNVLEKVKEGK